MTAPPSELTNWDALETPLYEEPLFHIDERDNDPASEDDRQGEFARIIRATPGVRIAAFLNDHNWGQKALNRARKLGAWWGFPDSGVLAEPRLIAFCEFKNGKRMPEQHQVDCLNALHRMGFPVGVFRRADSALAFLAEQGFPVAEVRRAA